MTKKSFLRMETVGRLRLLRTSDLKASIVDRLLMFLPSVTVPALDFLIMWKNNRSMHGSLSGIIGL